MSLIESTSVATPRAVINRPREIEFVKQKLPADCGLCCIAMLTGIPYERVFLTAPCGEEELLFGLEFQQVITTMRQLGLSVRWHWPEKYNPNMVGIPFRDKMRGKTGIYLVPSINRREEGCYHYVVVVNGEVYDPSPLLKRHYLWYHQLEPLAMIYLA
jgi:hypothetical protein